MRRLVILSIVAVVGVGATSCGGTLSLSDYADQVEKLVVDMITRLDQLDRDYMTASDLDDVRHYAHERVDARERMLEGLEDLQPPEALADLHQEAVEIMALLTEAERNLAARVDASDEFISVGALWNTPEGVEASEATMRAYLLCEAAQASFDRTRSAEDFEDVPWIPPEMKDVIDVAFGCHVTDRRR